MMPGLNVRTCLIAYLAISMGTLFWQLFAKDFFAVCEFNAGACAAAFSDYGMAALSWPVYLVLWMPM